MFEFCLTISRRVGSPHGTDNTDIAPVGREKSYSEGSKPLRRSGKGCERVRERGP